MQREAIIRQIAVTIFGCRRKTNIHGNIKKTRLLNAGAGFSWSVGPAQIR